MKKKNALLSSPFSSFEISVWSATRKIPRGRVATYSQIALIIGKPGAARAVGNALRKNPFAPNVPCHRVVRSDGSIGGFNGMKNNPRKEKLLREEGVEIKNGKIALRVFGKKENKK